MAQSVVRVSLFSSFSARVVFHIVNFALSYVFIIFYLYQIKKGPFRSLNYEQDLKVNDIMGYQDGELDDSPVIKVQVLSMLCMATGLAAVIIGMLKLKWGVDKISATSLVVCFLIGCVSYKDINVGFNRFTKGRVSIISAVFIIGFINCLTALMSNGMTLDTVIYWLAEPISHMGAVLGAGFMLLVSVLISFFISPGSGRIATVMPIMVPIADLTGITRQVAAQAFQFGDEFINCVIPIIGTLMGGLGFVDISHGKYLKETVPLILAQIILASFALMLPQSIGWTGLQMLKIPVQREGG